MDTQKIKTLIADCKRIQKEYPDTCNERFNIGEQIKQLTEKLRKEESRIEKLKKKTR